MNKQFITYLGNKLKTGNLRSIHLNALPGRYLTRLDLTDLDLIAGKTDEAQLFESKVDCLSEDFLFQKLLSKKRFQFKLHFGKVPFSNLDAGAKKKFDKLARRLNAIYNQNEDNYLEHGIRTFGFGYPILVKRSKKDPNKIIKAPLLIWNLDIQRSSSAKNQWIIEKTPEAPIYVNEVLLSHINIEEDISFDEAPIQLQDKHLVEVDELQAVIHQLLSRFSYEIGDLQPMIERCPKRAAIEENITDTLQLYWSGVFGIFRTQKQSIIKDTENLISYYNSFNFSIKPPIARRESNNTSVLTDPSQEEIISTLEEKEFKIIQGPPGTGKSQTLTAIITNTIENEGKVLVVCEKKTALNVIYSNLQKIGLEKLVVIIDDVDRDRKKIVNTVRQIADVVKPKHQRFNERNYLSKLKKYDKLVNAFNERHQNLLKTAFRGYNLKEIVTDYLKYKMEAPLDNILFEEINFELSESEYDYLTPYFEEGADLYSEVDAKAQVFDSLGARLFTNPTYSIKNERGMFAKIKEEKDFLMNAGIQDLPTAEEPTLLAPFSANFKTVFDFDFFEKLSQQVQHALAFWQQRYDLLLKLNQHIEHVSIVRPNGFFKKVKRLSVFYQKIFTHLKTLNDLHEQLEKLQKLVDSLPKDTKNKPLKYSTSTKAMKLFSAKYRLIDEFWNRAPVICKSINKIIAKSKFTKVEKDLFEEEKQTVPRMEDVHYITSLLDDCLENRTYFKDYFEWRIFYEASPKLVQDCLNTLREVGAPDSWEAVFRYNYFYLLIDQESARIGDFNSNGKMLQKITKLRKQLLRWHKRKILKTWESKQLQSIKAFNRVSNIKWLFNHRKNSKYSRKNSLRNILHEEFDLFTNIFPVVLVNPAVCSSIIPLKTNLFEVVIFDEASQLRLEDTYPSLVRGRIKVISGDKHQMPPSDYFSGDIALEAEAAENSLTNEDSGLDQTNPLYLAESESLLEFGNNLNPNKVHTSFLDFHYRSHHPYLIAFSNAAFYGSRLICLPKKEEYQPIRFFQLDGIYQQNGTNPVEANRIIAFLLNDYPTHDDGSYPSLGIATFNMQQRNLLKDLIHEQIIKDDDFRRKMNQIGSTDNWFVKNLENVQGDERDIIILSTTFGPNEDGKFLQNFGLLNTSKGYRLLNVIITRAKHQLCVFSSIPEDYFSKHTGAIIEKGNRGKGILYAYLAYCKAIEMHDLPAIKNILGLIEDACEEDRLLLHEPQEENPFEEELYHYITEHISDEFVEKDYQLGGYRLDFVLLNAEKEPTIAIECDGALWHNSPQAYVYDMHRQRILEQQGLQVFRVWAMAWWPNPEKEIKRLVEFVQAHCPTILD